MDAVISWRSLDGCSFCRCVPVRGDRGGLLAGQPPPPHTVPLYRACIFAHCVLKIEGNIWYERGLPNLSTPIYSPIPPPPPSNYPYSSANAAVTLTPTMAERTHPRKNNRGQPRTAQESLEKTPGASRALGDEPTDTSQGRGGKPQTPPSPKLRGRVQRGTSPGTLRLTAGATCMVYHCRHPRQLRPTCHQTACNYAQDRLGYVGQQKQVAKTANTKHTDTNKEPP